MNQDLNDIVNCALPATGGTLTNGTLAGTTTLPGSGAITTTGSVGIGTTSPGAPLAILGPSGSPATSGTVQNGLVKIQDGGGNGLDIGNYAAGPFGVWMQSGYVDNYSSEAYYPIILNPLGGNVGIGAVTSPAFPLDIVGGTTIVASDYGCSTGYGALGSIEATGGNSCSNSFAVSLRTQDRILAPEVDATSDMRLKTFVSALSPPAALDAIDKLKPLFFKWKPQARQNDTSLKAGFFAQQVAPYIPVAVSQAPGVLKDQYFLNYDALIPYLVSAVQELHAENKQLNARLDRDTAAHRVRYTR